MANDRMASEVSRSLQLPFYIRFLVSFSVSLLFLYNIPLRLRHAAHVHDIDYPVMDPMLLSMAEQDLSQWGGDDETMKTYAIPDPSTLRQYSPYLSVVHISTKTGISFLNDLEHLRMLWFGCSLHRILHFLRSKQLSIDTYIILNIGDGEVANADIPIFSKAHNRSDNSVDKNNIMIPYEELLWSYKPTLKTSFRSKKRQVVFRGGCTNPWRSQMVNIVRNSVPSDSADVQLSCEPNYTPLTPQQQSHARCLLDYDGTSYSRRTAWYLETGSVILRGGVVDDVVSRLARLEQDPDSEAMTRSAGAKLFSSERTPDEKFDASPVTIAFWDAETLVSSVERCLKDDEWSRQLSEGASLFWQHYVQRGKAVWEGYLTHLLLEQSKRWEILPFSEHHEYFHHKHAFYSTLSSTLVCPLIQDAAVPTGDAGILQWMFILHAVALSFIVFTITYHLIVPHPLHLLLTRMSYARVHLE